MNQVGSETKNCGKGKRKKVLILAPFFSESAVWISDFCFREDLEFRKEPFFPGQISWHERGAKTPISEWWEFTKYVYQAMKWRPDIIVTCFPQLAFVTAALTSLSCTKQPSLIAWNFNLGSLPRGLKRAAMRAAFQRVDRFIVHARGEIETYSRFLGLPKQSFRFVPLQKGRIGNIKPTSIAGRYIVSMGSANRDYETFINAIAGSGIRTVVISKKEIVESLPDCDELIRLSTLSASDCDSIMNGASMNVVPILPTLTASGQVTFTTSMLMGIPTIATLTVGSRDYIESGRTGLLVPPHDANSLRDAIETLWYNDKLRQDIAHAGQEHAARHFSDEAVALHLSKIIDELI